MSSSDLGTQGCAAGRQSARVCVRVKVNRRRHFLVIACARTGRGRAAAAHCARRCNATPSRNLRTTRAVFRSHRKTSLDSIVRA